MAPNKSQQIMVDTRARNKFKKRNVQGMGPPKTSKQCAGYGVLKSQHKTMFRIWTPQSQKTMFRLWFQQQVNKNNVQDMSPQHVKNKCSGYGIPERQTTNVQDMGLVF